MADLPWCRLLGRKSTKKRPELSSAIWPRAASWTCRKEIKEGSLVSLPLAKRKLRRRWGVLHWGGRRLSLAEGTFIGLCEEVAEKFG